MSPIKSLVAPLSLSLMLLSAQASQADTQAASSSVPASFVSLAQECAADVHHALLGRVATVESSGNPFAIGVVGGHLARQPKNLLEALATVKALDAGGWNYSMGLVQVNVHTLERYGQTAESIFEPCTNLRTGAAILKACYARAKPQFAQADGAVRAALSCYYTGDLTRGAAYAQKVAAAVPASDVQEAQPIEVVPDVRPAGGAARRAAARPGRAARSAAKDDWFTTYGEDDEDGQPNGQVNGQASDTRKAVRATGAVDDQ
ncbi:type IV secretion system protein VirB1 [Paraburkholderia sp. BL18I3N2]|uniref:lytic transglycosylase domain-containing protein n=1 Tax=unclassified Paraburkholderia TaxID=2615204 RepID=UPI000D04F37C|nr:MULTISPECIES: lytic transglycosylase domain-containing protein [unclassified Paraburkholderia]PRX23979.1 type IV secretion system protein VirB1 [Paraburkholderia sp. BL18I3N2]PRX95957.1 type IV secretion system protein VirB1 [Paraburkholderia sp. BL25I1N1]